MRIALAIGAVLFVIAVGVVGFRSGGATDEANDRNACLYEAVRAYPTWDTGNGPLLDHIDACKGVDQTEIRQLMTAFVAAVNLNKSKG